VVGISFDQSAVDAVGVEPAPRQVAARPFRILFDGRKLGHGGIGVYAENLIAGLVETPGVAVAVAGNPVKIESYPWAEGVTIVPTQATPYSLNEIFVLGAELNAVPCDVFHTPHYVLPFGLQMPTVVTVHDLIQVTQPERFYYPVVAGGLIRSALRRATRVLTVSAASQRELCAFARTDRLCRKISIIPNAVDPTFTRPVAELGIEGSFNLPSPYLLAVVSMAKPHKGVAPLIEAFAWARERSIAVSKATLALVGYGANGEVIRSLASRYGCSDAVRILGRVTKPELAALYAGARGVVCPSRAEGFCLPVLEAHAAGTPVVVTPVPAIQELVTSADVVCDDFSVGALGRGMMTFLERPAVTFGARGEVIAQYSRRAVAERALAVYREAATQFRREAGR
jgi:glycosyltransferase involved in cell wall biosynthesis